MKTARVTIVVNLPVVVDVEARWSDGLAEIVQVLGVRVERPSSAALGERMRGDDRDELDTELAAVLPRGDIP